jgi:hypothetical protein
MRRRDGREQVRVRGVRAVTDQTELHRAVGRIEGKIDTFIAQMKAQDDRTTNLEVRTRKMENKQYWLSGVGAAFGALAAIFGKTHL